MDEPKIADEIAEEVRAAKRAVGWTSWPRALFAGFVILLALGATARDLNWCGEAGSVAQSELGPSALLAKYTWLKEAHAQLDRKQADIKLYRSTLTALDKENEGTPRSKWNRVDLDTYNQRATEVAGVVSSYNDLAAQYNAKMAEVNWAFANVGQLPQGATEPLPRDYAPYRSE